jgi:hypothetical protein
MFSLQLKVYGKQPLLSTQPVVKGDSLQVANQLLFADRDLVNRDVFNMFNHLSEDVCLQFLSTVRAIFRITDEYVRFDDTNGNPYIVYANNGNVFIPTCINVNQIQVLTNFSNCYEDLPVIVTYFSTNVSAFLTTDLILRTTSRIVNRNMIKYRFLIFLIPKFYSNILAPQLVKSNVKTFCGLQSIQTMS